MTHQDKEQLKLEIDHIFESGANEIRIFEMVVNFIDNRNGVNKNLRIADYNVVRQSEQLVCSCGHKKIKTASGCECGNAKCNL